MAEITNTTLALPARGMDLAATLFCGQSFAWEGCGNGSFAGVAGGRAVVVQQVGNRLLLHLPGGGQPSAKDAAFWENYFDLGRDYDALQAVFSTNKALAACVAHAPGVRLLRQPFFDTLLSFIISQNNNIPRITGIVSRLRTQFGDELAPGVHAFPTPQRLAALAPEALSGLRAGFRAKYLVDAAQKVAAGPVNEKTLDVLSDDEARVLLMTICGVGPKVADCVLLYGLGRQDVVPMDVWMKRAMEHLFPAGIPPCASASMGLAQLHVFCWARDRLPRGG